MANNSSKMHQVSRHTLVVRKARENDAKRFEGREDEAAALNTRREKARKATSGDSTTIQAANAAWTASGPSHGPADAAASTARTFPAGRQVLAEDARIGPELSTVTMFFGPSSMSSVKVSGGNTIAKFESGRRVVIRGEKRLNLRRQAIFAYVAGYFLLFGLYGFFLLRGAESVPPEDFLRRAFPRLREGEAPTLKHTALASRPGRRTPAEVRLAQTLSFRDREEELVRLEAGSRLTVEAAVKLGEAIHDDLARPPGARVFAKPLQIYRENWYAALDWPHWLAVYNSLGFFLLVVLFLWKPLLDYLAAQGSKTALAMLGVREAREEAGKFNARYGEMAADIETRRQEMLAEAENETGVELTETLTAARRHALEIEAGSKMLLEIEAAALASRLGETATLKACERARLILERRLDAADHDVAIEALIADIAALRPETIRGG